MNKESFILFTEQKEVFENLSDEQAGQLIKAIFSYIDTGQIPQLELTLKMAFIPIRQNLDRNNEKWEDIKQKRSEAGKLGAEIKKQKQANQANANFAKSEKANQAVNVNVNDNVNVNVNGNVNDKYIASEEKSSTATAKASKHKYGKFKNVLLKDEELQRLKDNYNNWEELIEHLSYYIEMKGYKAKSHYLAIKKWVVNAVAEENTRKAKTGGNPFFEILQEEGKL